MGNLPTAESLDYRSILSESLKRRQLRNPDYSLRAFARDLEMSPQKLSQVLSGRTGLSSRSARAMAERLSLKPLEKELFVALVEAKHSRSSSVREFAVQKIERVKNALGFKEVSKDEFNLISQWFHMAACMLVEVEDFQPDIAWISRRLGLSEDIVDAAYKRLFETGLLRIDERGRWVRSATNFFVSSDTPSAAFRDYYRQLWAIADKTLDAEPMASREFAASMISISDDDIEYVRGELDGFRKTILSQLANRPGAASRVYAMTFQFFPVDLKGRV